MNNLSFYDLIDPLNDNDNIYIYEKNSVFITKNKDFLNYSSWIEWLEDNHNLVDNFYYHLEKGIGHMKIYMIGHGREKSMKYGL